MTHHVEMLMYAENTYAATNVQLRRLKREKVLLISKTFRDDMALPEAVRWKVASGKEKESLQAQTVYDLVPITSIPPGQKGISSSWVSNIKADNSFKGRGSCRHGGQ